MNRYYLGLDVATSCGWAVLRAAKRGQPGLLVYNTMDLSAVPSSIVRTFQADLIRNFSECAVRGYGTGLEVGLEEPYLDKSPKTFKVLALLVGRFQQAFESVGIVPVLVPAQTWQTAVLGQFGGKRREDRKKAALIWAKAMFGLELSQDAADAAGLAYYLATKERA